MHESPVLAAGESPVLAPGEKAWRQAYNTPLIKPIFLSVYDVGS